MTKKNKLKQYYYKIINHKIYKWINAIFNLALFIFIIELISGSSDFGRFSGWGLLIIMVIINLWGIWKSRNLIKMMKQYIFYVAKEKASEHKKSKKKK